MKLNRDKNVKIVIYILFFAAILYLHKNMIYISDDDIFRHYLEKMSLADCLKMTFFDSTGKFFTDTAGAILTSIPMWSWKIFDSAIYIIIVKLFMYLLVDEDNAVNLTIVCSVVIMYPFTYLGSAGYIVTSTNYVYTTVCILVAMVPLKTLVKVGRAPVWQCLLGIAATMYASNQEQAAVILISGLTLIIVGGMSKLTFWQNTDLKKCNKFAMLEWGFGIVIFLITMLSPAHIKRTASITGPFTVPGYADWTVGEKLYRGYTATVANIFFQPIALYGLLCFLLFVLSIYIVSKFTKIIAVFPLAIEILMLVGAFHSFIVIYDYACNLPDIKKCTDSIWNGLPIVLSIIVWVSIIIVLYNCFQDKRKAIGIISILLLGAGSREMMGFSATLFGSSYRTFTYMLYGIMAVCILLFQELWKKPLNKYVRVALLLFIWSTAMIACYESHCHI